MHLHCVMEQCLPRMVCTYQGSCRLSDLKAQLNKLVGGRGRESGCQLVVVEDLVRFLIRFLEVRFLIRCLSEFRQVANIAAFVLGDLH